MPGGKKKAAYSAAPKGCMLGEAQNPGGSGLALGRAESTLSQPELQEFMNLQAYERRGTKKPTTQNKPQAHHIQPAPSDPERNVQFQAVREVIEQQWANIKGKGTESRQRFVLKSLFQSFQQEDIVVSISKVAFFSSINTLENSYFKRLKTIAGFKVFS